MSITGHLVQVEPDALAAIRRDPSRLNAMHREIGLSLLGALVDALIQRLPVVGWVWRNLPSGPSDVKANLDLGGQWSVLHWCLTGSEDEVPGPAGDAILGGEPLGDDFGYGPARVLDPERVRAVAELLDRLQPAGVVARLDSPAQRAWAAAHPLSTHAISTTWRKHMVRIEVRRALAALESARG